MISTLAERKKIGNTFPSCLDDFGLDSHVQSRLHLAANRWTVLSPVRLLELNEEQDFRCIIDIFMVLHHYSRIHQKLDVSSKCLAYNGAHHTVSYGKKNKRKIILSLEYICTLLAYRFVSFQVAVCAFITILVILRSSIYKDTLSSSVAFKKIKLRSRDTASLQLASNGQSGNSVVPSDTNDSIKSSVYAASELSSTEVKFSKSHSAMQVFHIISISLLTRECFNYF